MSPQKLRPQDGQGMVHKSTHVLQHRCKMLTDCCKAPIRATVLASPWPITSSLFWLRNADLRIRAAATLCRVCSSHAVVPTMGIFMFGMDRDHKGDRSQLKPFLASPCRHSGPWRRARQRLPRTRTAAAS